MSVLSAQGRLRGGISLGAGVSGATGSYVAAGSPGTTGYAARTATTGPGTSVPLGMALGGLGNGTSPQPHSMLLLLVALEAAMLIWGRVIFRSHHAG